MTRAEPPDLQSRKVASVVRQKFLNMIFGVNGPSQF